MSWRQAIGALMGAGVLTAGCAGAMTEQKPLYGRLGGKPAIQAVVDDFIGNVAADGRINKRFANANFASSQDNAGGPGKLERRMECQT